MNILNREAYELQESPPNGVEAKKENLGIVVAIGLTMIQRRSLSDRPG